MKAKHHHTKKWAAIALSGSLLAGMSTTAESAVVIFFEQIGSDVRVSAEGTLALDPTLTTDTSLYASSNDFAFPDAISGSHLSTPYYFAAAGTPIDSPVQDSAASTNDVSGETPFGFSGETIQWDAADITGGSVGNVSEVTWTRAKDFFVLPGRDLVTMGADNLQNFLAWTATTTGDQIFLQTVPEPASALMLGSGIFGMSLRRRRKQ